MKKAIKESGQLGLFDLPGPNQEQKQAPSHTEESQGSLVIATWNINSIRARLELVTQWLGVHQPDIVCLQETKVTDNLFPRETFARLGYQIASFGQRQYNGVALLSRIDITDIETGLGEEGESEARCVAATIGGLRIASVYVPNASSTTDPSFASKTAWLRKLMNWVKRSREAYDDILLCGDFNVAPMDSDVHAPSYWLYRTFIHPEVRSLLKEVASEGLIDLHRHINREAVAYTWWDYRNDAIARNEGMRIDHIYTTSALAACCDRVFVDVEARNASKPSDHAPVVARFDLRKKIAATHAPKK